MVRSAYGTEAPPAGETSRLDLRAYDAALRLLDELDAFAALGEQVAARRTSSRRSSAPRCGSRRRTRPGASRSLDLLRARTRRFEVVFVLGLEEGSLPRRARTSPFLDDDARRELGGRLERPDQVSRDRYLFYTACTRATRRLYLVREAATDDGGAARAEPVLGGGRGGLRRGRRRAGDGAPAAVGAHLAARGGADRARAAARARAALGRRSRRRPRPLAEANDWGRRLARARSALAARDAADERRAARVLGAKTTFGVTELERFADCSSAWLFERIISPKTIDAEVDPMLRGSVAHSALHKFYAGLPKELGHDRVTPENVEQAVGFLRRCLDDALRGGVRLDLTDLQEAELDQSLWRDLERFVRDEAASPLQFVPRRFEVVVRLRPLGARAAARPAPRRRPPPERQDRPDRRRPVQRARDRAGLQVGPQRALGEADRRGAAAPDPALHARAARPRRHRAARRRLPRARRRARHARPAARRAQPRTCRASSATTTSTTSEFWSLVETARERGARLRAAHPRGRRPPRPEGRHLPDLVRPLDDVPGGASLT